MRRAAVDVLLTSTIVLCGAGLGAYLVWHVDNSPSRDELRACAYASRAERALSVDAPFGPTRNTIRQMSKSGNFAEDAQLHAHASHARTAMYDYHRELVQAGVPRASIDALPVRSGAATSPGAARFAARAEADVQQAVVACRRVERRH